MKTLSVCLLVVAVFVAGLFWSLGSDVHAIVTHFIAPPLFGMAIAASWRAHSKRRQLLLLVSVLATAELVRLVSYCLRADGWTYLSGDSETQLVLSISFGLQLIIAIATWCIAKLWIQRQPTHATN
jgi:hypothetical protein